MKKTIIELANERGNRVYAFCIMPDHVHVLVDSSESCGIIDFLRLLKGRFAYGTRKLTGSGVVLQKSFYDHVLRGEEGLYKTAEYIIENPVRKGLVEDHRKYPFSGSLVYDI